MAIDGRSAARKLAHGGDAVVTFDDADFGRKPSLGGLRSVEAASTLFCALPRVPSTEREEQRDERATS